MQEVPQTSDDSIFASVRAVTKLERKDPMGNPLFTFLVLFLISSAMISYNVVIGDTLTKIVVRILGRKYHL